MVVPQTVGVQVESLPSREAWIEIMVVKNWIGDMYVASLAGSVD